MTELFELLIPVQLEANNIEDAKEKAARLQVMLDGKVITTVLGVHVEGETPTTNGRHD